ncbi:phage tail sheath C-terminal domain-containing protein [Fusobacterium varium]|uniref:phage tail sheath C-terminal domain-containing protein n=1 Tax=Fusobacterium varium TaxID=856 RepID=UPI0035632237
MSTTNTMPVLDIVFKGLGVTAIQRGERGIAVLILKDSTEGDPKKYYKTIEDFGSEEQAKFTAENVLYVKDALEGIPLKLYVFKIGEEEKIEDKLVIIGGKIPRNCWIATNDDTFKTSLLTWVKAKVKNNKKRYKMLGFKLTGADDMHVTNFTNEKVTFSDKRGETTGDKAIPYLLGFLAGISINMSALAFELAKFKSVVEPEELDTAIKNGEFVLFNDEGIVKVARAVNSLSTLGQDLTIEMTHINTVEKMDLIYCDIYTAWDKSYKGKYPNILDNQMLLISAINSYYKSLARDYILDPNFENISMIDIEAQRLANASKYGEDVVAEWSDEKVKEMTVSTQVLFQANIKISGIMEDFKFPIYM